MATLARVAFVVSGCLCAAWLVTQAHNGYDMDYALIWGREIAQFQAPDFGSAFAPTPHPLANLFGAALSPLGRDGASDVFAGLVLLSLFAVAWAAFDIGEALGGRLAGGVAAVVLISRPALVASAMRGAIDLPALALTLFAVATLLKPEKAWGRALVLLAVAGLLRPETWILSLAVLAWRQYRANDWRPPVGLAALALSAPVMWVAVDLLLTGDPFFSLVGTQNLAEELGRPRTATLAPLLLPGMLTTIVGVPVLLAGLVGLIGRRWGQHDHDTALLGLLVLTFAGFTATGLAHLPLLSRYLLAPAALIAILGCLAATQVEPSRRFGLIWPGGVAILALLAAVPGTATGLSNALSQSRELRAAQTSLGTLASSREFHLLAGRCEPLFVANYRMIPAIAYRGRIPAKSIQVSSPEGTLILPRSGKAVKSIVSPSDQQLPLLDVPAGFNLESGAETSDWAVATSCGKSAQSDGRPPLNP